MLFSRPVVLTVLAMLAFAGNSLLCRAALQHTSIDAATFTSVRLATGAATLAVLVALRRSGPAWRAGSWPSAAALCVYAAGFSLAYVSLTAATGALLLFGAVQATMIGHGLYRGERLRPLPLAGLVMAFAGMGALLLPGLSAPPLGSAALMLLAGIAWGVYSLRGRGGGDPTDTTAGNFLRATPLALLVSVVTLDQAAWDWPGLGYAAASGALASGVGYALWYAALPSLRATQAATVQLSVPVIAAVGGVALLGEPLTLRLSLASIAILGGIALVIRDRAPRA
jgi:drug/metabolite transporter (DMT)-like permease